MNNTHSPPPPPSPPPEEMVELHHNAEFVVDTSAMAEAELLSEESPSTNDIFSEPEVQPRIGEQFQAVIPDLSSEECNFRSASSLCNSTSEQSACMLLPVPAVWVCNDKSLSIRRPLPHIAFREHSNPEETRGFNKMTMDCSLRHCTAHIRDINTSVISEQGSSSSVLIPNALDMLRNEYSHKVQMDNRDLNGWHLAPGTRDSAWTELEQDSFVLSLYIFGKNLVQVKKFVETKHMGDILSFYYGKFFGGEAHKRWSECRKIRSKRCIFGHRIFNGVRQQELLSRLSVHTSEETKTILEESTQLYNEGKVTLEDYVSIMKMAAGLAKLVEAIAIGKGKQDLTGIISEPSRTNQLATVRPEIPIGKAWSTLSSEDILKFLTGDYRLSKGRSSDLFWEAVWPRLLARGWHSEQPKNQNYGGSKSSLVFLIPGIKKFSRRKLLKGNQYFDSVTDVLAKVASEPKLLEIEIDAAKDREAQGSTWEADGNIQENGLSADPRHQYLRPKKPQSNDEEVQFTVVDTSLVFDDPVKFRELRSIPVETDMNSPGSSASESDSSDMEVNEPNSAEVDDEEANQQNSGEMAPVNPKISATNSRQSIINGTLLQPPANDNLFSFSILSLPNPRFGIFTAATNQEQIPKAFAACDQKQEPPAKQNPSMRYERQGIHRRRSMEGQYLSPNQKRRRTTMNNHGGTANRKVESLFTRDKVEKGITEHLSEPKIDHFRGADSDKILRVNRRAFIDINLNKKCDTTVFENPQQESTSSRSEALHPRAGCRRPYIDLNVPSCASDVEMDDEFHNQPTPAEDDQTAAYYHKDDDTTADLNQEHQNEETVLEASDMNTRRQSTRNRPLTTKALEALESGFFHPKRKMKGGRSGLFENDFVAPRSRRRRPKDDSLHLPTTSTSGNNSVEAATDLNGEKIDFGDATYPDQSGHYAIQTGIELNLHMFQVPKTSYHPETLVRKDGLSL